MRTLTFALVICLTSLSTMANEIITKKDSITLTRNKKDYVLKAGKEISLELPLYIDDFFGQTVVMANGQVKNTTDKDLRIIYVVSFYDSNSKLIGAANGDLHLAPGKGTFWGSAMLKGAEEKFKKIRSYKLNAFTFEVPPKKK